MIRGGHLLARGQVRGHAASLIAVARLDDHGHADLQRGRPGVFGVGDRPALGHRHADGREQHAGQFLVLGDLFGNGAGAVGFRRLDPPLPRAVAQLHQAIGVQSPGGNAAGSARPRRCARCWAPTNVVGQIAQASASRPSRSKGRSCNRGQHQLAGRRQASPRQRLLDVLENNAVNAGFGSLAGTSEAHVHARPASAIPASRVPGRGPDRCPGADAERTAPLADAAPMLDHRGQPCHQPVVKPGKIGRGAISIRPDRPKLRGRENWSKCSDHATPALCEIP